MPYTLPSRLQFGSAELFASAFLETLTPALIPRRDFIRWQLIDAKMADMAAGAEYYQQLGLRLLDGAELVDELRDSLLALDEPLEMLRVGLELMGHTNDSFATREDDIELGTLASAIAQGSAADAEAFARMMLDLGLERIVCSASLTSHLMGVQVGLETHRRKNTGGSAFISEVSGIVERALNAISSEGAAVELVAERRIPYDGGSKRVDLVVTRDGHDWIGIEGNFYTVAGSKPTEIKRSYADVQRRLHDVGVTLVWITDGKGYRAMKRSLSDAFRVMPNIYNLEMASKCLEGDLRQALLDA